MSFREYSSSFTGTIPTVHFGGFDDATIKEAADRANVEITTEMYSEERRRVNEVFEYSFSHIGQWNNFRMPFFVAASAAYRILGTAQIVHLAPRLLGLGYWDEVRGEGVTDWIPEKPIGDYQVHLIVGVGSLNRRVETFRITARGRRYVFEVPLAEGVAWSSTPIYLLPGDHFRVEVVNHGRDRPFLVGATFASYDMLEVHGYRKANIHTGVKEVNPRAKALLDAMEDEKVE